jgi:hypothetical protein
MIMEAKKKRTRWTPTPVIEHSGWVGPGDNPRRLEDLTSSPGDRTFHFTVWHTASFGWQWEVTGPVGLRTGPRRVGSGEEAFRSVEEFVAGRPSNLGNGCW